MSEPTEATAEPRAITLTRERLITEAPMAMFDSAAFEHLQRVATVIYRSGFVPRSLTHAGPSDTAEELPESMVVARCILLADQAQRAGADVIGYIQATSVINGRLMHEGKLVNAIVQRRLGIRLKYRFGLWDTDHIEFPVLVTDENDPRFREPVDPAFFHGAAERLAVRAYNPEAPDEYVEGSAGQWKTTRSGSPWTKQADWPRQLRYRAVREWARAYDPGTVLGMLADGDEEIEMVRDITPKPSGVLARLEAGDTSANGFDAAHVERETKPRGRRKAAEAASAPAEAQAEPEVAGEPQGPQDTAPVVEEPASPSTPPPSEDGPEAGAATSAPTELPADEAEQMAFTDAISVGYPAPDEIYMLNGDEWVWNAERGHVRRDTYKNGEPFSDAGRDKGLAIYEDHAPAMSQNSAPPEASEAEPFPPEFEAYITVTETAGSWADVKTGLKAFTETGVWKGMTEDQANNVRANTWATLVEREVKWLPNHLTDVSAFRLWLEDQDDPAEIAAALHTLTNGEDYPGKPASMRQAIEAASATRMKLLKTA